jgi:ABC-2 type transport system ATP-binding protein
MNVLTISGVTKRYGRLTALDNVSFVVPEGAVYGILGPNGSGKTTLLGIVTDVLKASGGSTHLFDGTNAPEDTRKEMGVLLETPNFYPFLSARANLEIVATIKGKDPAGIPEALNEVNLLDRQDARFKTFSLGMKQRLAIASALLGDPRVVLLDEPTNGLDPEGISEIRMLVKQLAARGKTIVLASHLLDEVEKVCTHVAVLKKGKLLAAGTIRDALARGGNDEREGEVVSVELAAEDMKQLANALAAMDGLTVTDETEETITITTALSPGQVNRLCFDRGIALDKLVTRDRNLETRFLELTR